MLIADAHLDLSYNALSGRDVLKPAAEQVSLSTQIPTVGLPDLIAGSVKLICATVFAEPSLNGQPGYRTAEEAYAHGQAHLDWYRDRKNDGTLNFVKTLTDLSELDGPGQSAILLMEGADPLRTPDDLKQWFDFGLRIVGLAWKRTRMAGGTGDPGPLTAAGIDLLKAMELLGVIHDTSHLAEESFWQLLETTAGPVMASHSNCRAIVPTDRQLSDDMIRAIVNRGGIVGINFFDKFLLPPAEQGVRRANLQDVVHHVRHVCDLAGNTRHVGIGTDMDGGLGRDQIPVEIVNSGDLPKVADALRASGFGPDDTANIMGQNWFRFFLSALPRQS